MYRFIILLNVMFLSACSTNYYISEGFVTINGKTAEVALVLKEEDNHIRFESCGGFLAQSQLEANAGSPIQLPSTGEEYVTHEADSAGSLNKLIPPIKSRDNMKPCIAVWTHSKPTTREDFAIGAIPFLYITCLRAQPQATPLGDTGIYEMQPVRFEKLWHLPTRSVPSPKHCSN